MEWIKNYLSDIKITWSLVRYKRQKQNLFQYQQYQEMRSSQRSEMWNQEYNRVYDASGELFSQDQDDEYEYSNGNTGHRIKRKIDAGGKSIGMYSRWDLFYFGMKNISATPYASFIYLSTDGVSKHDGNVEVIGVDLV